MNGYRRRCTPTRHLTQSVALVYTLLIGRAVEWQIRQPLYRTQFRYCDKVVTRVLAYGHMRMKVKSNIVITDFREINEKIKAEPRSLTGAKLKTPEQFKHILFKYHLQEANVAI